jgi:fibronectin type 3 domain-containing protein
MTATNNLAKKIILKWKNLDDANVAGYNIFVSSNANMYYKKIATTKKDANTFEHKINKNNATRYYKIASFDKDGLQSDIRTLESIVGKTIDIPKTPKITLGLIKGHTVIINWKAQDNRAVSYIVEKSIKENLFQSKTKVYKGVRNSRFEDSDIKNGIKYKFTVQAVDKDGLISKQTSPIYLSLPLKKVK